MWATIKSWLRGLDPNDQKRAGMSVWAVLGTSLMLYLTTVFWRDAPGVVEEGEPEYAIGLVVVLGALGGFIRWMQEIISDKEEGDLSPLWVIRSILIPLKGASLALIFVLTLMAGLVGPPGQDSNVNWAGLYAIAGLVGLFSPEAIDRLEKVFKTLFGDGQDARPRDEP